MSNQLQKDIEDVEKFLNSPSPHGMFARRDEPMYKVLLSDVEYTGKLCAMAEFVALQRKAQHEFATIKLRSFVEGIELPQDKLEAIEEKISVFVENLKKGVYE